MPANLENSAVATGLEKVSFHTNPKEVQCQRMFKLPYSCTHFKLSVFLRVIGLAWVSCPSLCSLNLVSDLPNVKL